ncbi:limbic system-associated membrane protein [Eurytemora carolleeae]|uniref:limbic system-associated membrane protein n=1 Tax=Eurytemora carolleeae TaxID=1294199 RepID=UPI000C78A804|nr:limbic system-associated membrane protein [Eurytemora carolleeae]|eukprot:XP_023330427.1 limbic system-associated membrane protein-like [Eurytemora affinis]
MFVLGVLLVLLVLQLSESSLQINQYLQGGVSAALESRVSRMNLTVAQGSTARLSCNIRNIEDDGISWIRLKDYHILTNGQVTYTRDARFSILHSPGSGEWSLQIVGVQMRDAGEYQCQAATSTGTITLSTVLHVANPQARILGSREKHGKVGDLVQITCELRDNVGTPEFVFWYHNQTMINFQTGVRVTTSIIGPDVSQLWLASPNTTMSRLDIRRTRMEHAGEYTCAPSNSGNDTIRLYVSADSSLSFQQLEQSSSLTSSNGGQTHLLFISGQISCLFLLLKFVF